MAKTIKISLPINGQRLRTIEELQDNFVIDELLELYKQKILHKWLKSRGYEQELQKIEKIDNTDSKELIRALALVFGVNVDEMELELLVNSVNYQAPDKASSAQEANVSSGVDLKQKIEEYKSELNRLEKLGQDVLTECKENKISTVYGEQEVKSWEKLKSEMAIFCQEFAPVINLTLYKVSERFANNSTAAWCVLAAQRRWWQKADVDGVRLYVPKVTDVPKVTESNFSLREPYDKFFKKINCAEFNQWTILEERGKTCLVLAESNSTKTNLRAVENEDGFRWERIWGNFLLSDGFKAIRGSSYNDVVYLVI